VRWWLVIRLGIKEDTLKNENGKSTAKLEKGSSGAVSTQKKKQEQQKKTHYHSNFKQIFMLSFDALRERKTRSILTILSAGHKE
jgi:hypothetical protein